MIRGLTACLFSISQTLPGLNMINKKVFLFNEILKRRQNQDKMRMEKEKKRREKLLKIEKLRQEAVF